MQEKDRAMRPVFAFGDAERKKIPFQFNEMRKR
jgi:hypothetical protein